jgi:APA family basic amino acid/polyamine antiporter
MADNTEVARTLSFFDGVSIVVGLIVGVGIYETPPIIAASVDGVVELYAIWLVGGVLTVCGALAYAELGSAFPKAGGDYFFLKRSLGSGVAFVYGWSQLFLIRPGAIAAVSFPVATHISKLIGWTGIDSLVGAGVIVLLSVLNVMGANAGRILQNFLASASVALLLGLAAFCLIFPGLDVEPSSLAEPATTDYGLALILVLFCYGGWSELTFLGSEIKNPQRAIPGILIVGVGIVTGLYLLINLGFCWRLGLAGLASAKAPAVAVLPSSLHFLVAFLIVLCTASSLNALIMAGGRLGFAVSEDVSWLSALGRWDAERQSPVFSLLFQMFLSGLIALLAGSFANVLVYTTAVVWIFYFLVGVGLWQLRRKEPSLERPFRMWGYPITLLFFLASCLYLIWSSFNYDFGGTLITIFFCAIGALVFRFFNKGASEG